MFYKKRLSYSVINIAKSMLSMMLPACNGTEFGKHSIIALRRIFRNRPALPRYMVTYDLDLALNFLKSLPSWVDIILKWLTLEAVTILALLSGHKLTYVAHMDININRFIFYIPKAIENTTRSFHQQPIGHRTKSLQ